MFSKVTIIRRASLFVVLLGILGMFYATTGSARAADAVGRYRLFETAIQNDRAYANKFADVELLAQFKAPSGRTVDFRGFFDGDGKGGGSFDTGHVWKLRFMPDEIGTWQYEYRWSDGAPGGKGRFECAAAGAGKGILRAYKQNPRWFAYNGTDPVWIKSYYETGHGAVGQDFDWIVKNVYSKFAARGYNHLQVNWLLSLAAFQQFYHDGPPQQTKDLAIFKDTPSKMNLDAWRRMEQHLGWLNDNDISVHMFLGVDGGRNGGPSWAKLGAPDQDLYVRYMAARIAPFANLAGWNFVWEVEGSREANELGFMRLVMKYDVFEHLRTYEDEMPRENHYDLPEYTFAAVENHGIAAADKNLERHLYREPWTHHMACLEGYRDKPVYMSEGNALWRRYWSGRSGATRDDLRRAAWACATAGASFNWNGHDGEDDLVAGGPKGLPFDNEQNLYASSAREMDILADVMSKKVEFYKMQPHDELLVTPDALRVYALAEPGRQYLVFAPEGAPFAVKLPAGDYRNISWINAQTGEQTPAPAVIRQGAIAPVSFAAPDKTHDWVLILRTPPTVHE
jgi:hypothetical protein